MKILMSYSLGKDVSTVVRTIPERHVEHCNAQARKALATLYMAEGLELIHGDIWNGKEVTEAEAKVFFRPSHVSFIEG